MIRIYTMECVVCRRLSYEDEPSPMIARDEPKTIVHERRLCMCAKCQASSATAVAVNDWRCPFCTQTTKPQHGLMTGWAAHDFCTRQHDRWSAKSASRPPGMPIADPLGAFVPVALDVASKFWPEAMVFFDRDVAPHVEGALIMSRWDFLYVGSVSCPHAVWGWNDRLNGWAHRSDHGSISDSALHVAQWTAGRQRAMLALR